jgi:hypothetical protein
MFQQ